ncbi:uncharacterized protein LY79DRAFT_567064 [Colletotrichum navitas]|uniref:Uncharacterized protein n=1 Tax=Colletotrichum navitas TaxID=681940 RepID=A0AAD8PPL5_9PEZI|nr:uncharacterized protein LY79DRAFT_567064 [Colletotrichum navitas]KAK1574075.1 hypothetical protein LY79DRAFT_567064 [Colletotrichum navitas]
MLFPPSAMSGVIANSIVRTAGSSSTLNFSDTKKSILIHASCSHDGRTRHSRGLPPPESLQQHAPFLEKQHPLVSEQQAPPRSEKQHPLLLEKQHPPLSLKQKPGVSFRLSHWPGASADMGSILAYPSSSSSRDGLGRGVSRHPSPAAPPLRPRLPARSSAASSPSPKLLQEPREPSASPSWRTEGRDVDAEAVEDVSYGGGASWCRSPHRSGWCCRSPPLYIRGRTVTGRRAQSDWGPVPPTPHLSLTDP